MYVAVSVLYIVIESQVSRLRDRFFLLNCVIASFIKSNQ